MKLGFCHCVIIQWIIPSLPSTAVIVTFTFYIILAQTLDRWPRALSPVSNEGRAYVKNQQHFTVIGLCGTDTPRVTWPASPENATTAMEPGKESKPLSTASHLHNKGRRLFSWLHRPVTVHTRRTVTEAAHVTQSARIFTWHTHTAIRWIAFIRKKSWRRRMSASILSMDGPQRETADYCHPLK